MTAFVRRRELITLLSGAAAAWPLAARAQQAHNAHHRSARSDIGSRICSRVTAVQRVRRNIAIVFAGVSDPVGLHFVDSLARPGGNVTGFTTFEFSPVAKLLEALKEIAPGVTRVALIFDPDNPSSVGHLRSFETAAPSFAVKSIAAAVHSPAEIERAIEAFARERDGGLLVPPNTTLTSHRDLIVALAARFRLPAVYPFRVFVTAGGLMSYGADRVDQFVRAASYVDRILKGARPARFACPAAE